MPIYDHIIIGKNDVYSFKENSEINFPNVKFNVIKKNHFIENPELNNLFKEDILEIPKESIGRFDYQEIDDDLIR